MVREGGTEGKGRGRGEGWDGGGGGYRATTWRKMGEGGGRVKWGEV